MDEPRSVAAPAAATGPPALVHALRSYWYLIALPIVVFAVVAVALGLNRSPTYSTQAELNVGQTNLATQALPGFVDGAQALADSYSRVVQSAQVRQPVARRLRLTEADVESRLTAVPVPDRTVFRIKGDGPSERDAELLARTAVDELQRYARSQATQGSEPAQTLAAYRRAAADVERLVGRVSRLKARDVTGPELSRANVDLSTARLRLQGLAATYQQARPTQSAGASIQILDQPDTATNDRSSVTQQYLAVAIILGLIVGLALAITVSGRSWRRAVTTA